MMSGESPPKRSSSSSSNVNLSSTGGTIDDLSDELLQHICGVYFEGIAAVLRPSVVCRRWRALLIADDVWEGKFERDGMRAKAALFEVSVPMKKSDVRAVELLARRVTVVLYCEIFLLKVCRVRRNSGPHRTHRAAAPQGFKMKNQVWELDDIDTGKMEGASLARGALSTTSRPRVQVSKIFFMWKMEFEQQSKLTARIRMPRKRATGQWRHGTCPRSSTWRACSTDGSDSMRTSQNGVRSKVGTYGRIAHPSLHNFTAYYTPRSSHAPLFTCLRCQ